MILRGNRDGLRRLRNRTLVGAIIGALAMGATGMVAAQTSNYTLDASTPTWSQYLSLQDYLHSVNNTQSVNAGVSSSLPGDSSVFITYSGTNAASTNSGNTLDALSVGNNATGSPSAPTANDRAGNSIDLGLLGADGLGNSGLGILSGQLNYGNSIAAGANGLDVVTTLTGSRTGNVTQNDNTIRADVVKNDASSRIDGALPAAAFAGTTDGSSSLAFDGASTTVGTDNSAGDITVSNAQANVNTTGIGASASGDTINISDGGNGAAAITADFSNSDNTIAGSHVGNRSDNAVTVTGADGAPSYNGSVVVSNGQANLNAPIAVSTNGSQIGTTLADGSLHGTVTQSDDTLSSNAQGNVATNALQFATGIDVQGNAPGTNLGVVFGSNAVNVGAGGDLVLTNLQGNQAGTTFNGSTSGDAIQVTANAVATADASVTLHGDRMVSSITGNGAGNTVSADGASFAAGVAVGSVQSNDTANISAQTSGNTIGARFLGAAASTGQVSVDANSMGVGATGNQATTHVDLSGTRFDAGGGTVLAGTTATGADAISANTGGAGISVANVQTLYGAVGVSASEGGDYIQATYFSAISAGSSSVSNNAATVSAGGNDASTAVALAGDNGQFSAALVNDQYGTNSIYAYADGIQLGIGINVAGTAVSDAALTVNGNAIRSSAYGNQGSNALSTDFTNLTLGDGADPWVAPSSMIDPTQPSNQVHAALALASTQMTDDNTVSANNGGNSINAFVTGDVTGAQVTVDGDLSTSTAIANRVDNTLAPGVGNLTAFNGTATQVGALGNLQVANQTFVSAGTFTGQLTGASISGDVTGSDITVSGSATDATAAGNVAGNAMAFSGTQYAPGPVTDPNSLNGLNLQSTTALLGPFAGLVNSAAFAVQNVQLSTGGARIASTTNGAAMFGTSVGGQVTDGSQTVSGNEASATARDNSAANSLALDGFTTLTTTAALQSEQDSSAFIQGIVSGGGSITALDNINAAALTLSGNALASSAVANVANNGLTVSAGQLGGDGLDHQIGNLLGGTPGTVSGALDADSPPDFLGGTLADYGLANIQIREFDSGPVMSITSTTGLGIVAGFLNGGGVSLNGGSASVNGNRTTALAQDNSASNRMALTVTSSTATAALSNHQFVDQNNDADATATASGLVPYSFAIIASGNIGNTAALPLTVSGNTMAAQAGLNDAQNTVLVNGDSELSASNDILFGAGNIDLSGIVGAVVNGAVADYALSNDQISGSSASAELIPGLTGIRGGGQIGGGGTSAVTVADNHFASQASANSAGNSVTLDGASIINAGAALSNAQFASGDGTTVQATTADAEVGVYATTGGNVRNANLDVSGNTLGASASGNSAGNAVSVLPTALNAGPLGATLTGGSRLSVSGVLNGVGPVAVANANTTLANQQHNQDTISASVQDSNIGVNSGAPGLPSALLTSTATVVGNAAAASGMGNSASNAITLASLATGVSSSALVSNQLDEADVGASVVGVQIGVNAGANSSTPVTVSGNTISATGVGNSVGNHIGIGN